MVPPPLHHQADIETQHKGQRYRAHLDGTVGLQTLEELPATEETKNVVLSTTNACSTSLNSKEIDGVFVHAHFYSRDGLKRHSVRCNTVNQLEALPRYGRALLQVINIISGLFLDIVKKTQAHKNSKLKQNLEKTQAKI